MLSLSTKVSGFETNKTYAAVDGKKIKFSRRAGDQIFVKSVTNGNFGKLKQKEIKNQNDDIKNEFDVAVFEFSDDHKDKLDRISKEINGVFDVEGDTICYAAITGADFLNQCPPPHSMKLRRSQRTMVPDPDNSYEHKLNGKGLEFKSRVRMLQVMDCSNIHRLPTESPIWEPSESPIRRVSISFTRDDEDEEDDDDDDDDDESVGDDFEEELKADEFVKSTRKRKFAEQENDDYDDDDDDTIAARMMKRNSKRRKLNNGSSRSSSRASSRAPTVSSMATSRASSKGKSTSAAVEDYGDDGLFEDAEEYRKYPSDSEMVIMECTGSVIDGESEAFWGIFACSDGNGNRLGEDYYEPLASNRWTNEVREGIFDALMYGDGTKLIFE